MLCDEFVKEYINSYNPISTTIVEVVITMTWQIYPLNTEYTGRTVVAIWEKIVVRFMSYGLSGCHLALCRRTLRFPSVENKSQRNQCEWDSICTVLWFGKLMKCMISNALYKCPTMHHLVPEMYTYKWCIVGHMLMYFWICGLRPSRMFRKSYITLIQTPSFNSKMITKWHPCVLRYRIPAKI